MIELISPTRCIRCNQCVSVCPTGVFEAAPDGPPVIARHEDCQTCFMCELYCPADALYVAPQAEEHAIVDEERLAEEGLLGSYRKSVGWGRGRTSTAARDEMYIVFRYMNH